MSKMPILVLKNQKFLNGILSRKGMINFAIFQRKPLKLKHSSDQAKSSTNLISKLY